MFAKFLRSGGAFLVATAIAAILGAVLSSLWVAYDLAAIGAPVSPSLIARTALTDVAGMGLTYGVILAAGFLIAFAAAAVTHRVSGLSRPTVFLVAGVISVAVTLALMKPVFFGANPIAGARSALGLAAQALAGGLAGFVFAALTPRPKREIDA